MIGRQFIGQRLAVKKDDRAQRLILTRLREPSLDSHVGQKGGDFRTAQFGGRRPPSISGAMKAEELLNPAGVLFARRLGEMCPPTGPIESLQEHHDPQSSTLLGMNKNILADVIKGR